MLTTVSTAEEIQHHVWERDAAWEGEGCPKDEREAGCWYVLEPIRYLEVFSNFGVADAKKAAEAGAGKKK